MEFANVPDFEKSIYLLSHENSDWRYGPTMYDSFLSALRSIRVTVAEMNDVLSKGTEVKKQEIESRSKKNKDDYFLTVAKNTHLDKHLPREIWKAMFLASCSIFEATLVDICKYKNNDKKCNKSAHLSLVQSIICQLCEIREDTFDSVVTNGKVLIEDNSIYKNDDSLSKLIKSVVDTYKIRNCIAHNNGKIKLCGKNNIKIIKEMQKKSKGLHIVSTKQTSADIFLGAFSDDDDVDDKPNYVQDGYKKIELDIEFILNYLDDCILLLDSIFVVNKKTALSTS